MNKVLVFFPTYNEAGNTSALIDAIREYLPNADILVIDDASPDGTGERLDSLAKARTGLRVIHRPRKMGVGSAHKLAILYARHHQYDSLITMDADFSHHPRYLPNFVDHLRKFDFVTGSRYVDGGSCNYGLYRTFISRAANLVAQIGVGLRLKENTTLYRGYRLPLMERLNINRIKSEGYSFAVESIYRISQIAEGMAEFPIDFENRLTGQSKISKKEIYRAILTVLRLSLGRLINYDLSPATSSTVYPPPLITCGNCGGIHHIELFPPREPTESIRDRAPYSCAHHSVRTHGQILRCLQCGMIFMRPKFNPKELVQEYVQVEDPTYLKNVRVRERMFEYNLSKVAHYTRPGQRLLDVGSYCGAFLKVARDQGLEVVGVEPSSWAVEVSRSLVDAPVFRGTLGDLPEEIGTFDVITLWDVLEHMADPIQELKKINSLLKPQGTFLFSTLMIDNWFPKLTGKHWPWLMEMHLYYFTEETISDVLDRSRFTIMESFAYCHMVNLSYLFDKLETLGLPKADLLGKLVAGNLLGEKVVPFKLGDIKLFVCKKRL
ncbi:MAG: methyltransferase domain-containing protein [Deltaproteobacteria bacterium]|nr:methyltransferase domain-containing protein [Deltaproteobacteria bacterium]